MNNFDLSSKKYTIILFVIMIAFALMIIKAFDYLPEESNDVNSPDMNQALNLQNRQFKQKIQEKQSVDEEEETETVKKELNIDLQSSIDIPEEIDKPAQLPSENIENIAKIEPLEEPSPKISTEQQLELRFFAAQKYCEEKQYVKALEEYKQIAESESSVHVQARCYEEMANIYGIVKRYGTALSYAQRAYNMEPTTNREMLLSRLYYKTGDLDKATKRMNNVLKREFSED